jgi:hypothetical protein
MRLDADSSSGSCAVKQARSRAPCRRSLSSQMHSRGKSRDQLGTNLADSYPVPSENGLVTGDWRCGRWEFKETVEDRSRLWCGYCWSRLDGGSGRR